MRAKLDAPAGERMANDIETPVLQNLRAQMNETLQSIGTDPDHKSAKKCNLSILPGELDATHICSNPKSTTKVEICLQKSIRQIGTQSWRQLP